MGGEQASDRTADHQCAWFCQRSLLRPDSAMMAAIARAGKARDSIGADFESLAESRDFIV
jgi:hypothetical protein